jgi:hypothetical protein
MITHSSKASSRTADMHSSSPFHTPCLHITTPIEAIAAAQAKIPSSITQRVRSSANNKKVHLHRYSYRLPALEASLTLCTDTSATLTLLPSKIGPVSAAPTYLDIDADEQCNYKRSAQVTGTASHHLCRARSVTATPCSNTTAKKQVNRGQDWQQKPHLLL